MVDVGAGLIGGEAVGHCLADGRRLGHQARRSAGSSDFMPRHHDGYRLGHPVVGHVDSHRIALIHDQGRRRVLGQVVGVAVGIELTAGHVPEAPHVEAGALGQGHVEGIGVELKAGRVGRAIRPGRSPECRAPPAPDRPGG